MLKHFIWSISLLSLVSCGPRQEGNTENKAEAAVEKMEITDPAGNVERFSRRVSDYARHGEYTRTSPDGHLLESAYFVNDSLHGERVLYYATGDTQIVETYRNGYFEGPYRAYYANKQLELAGQYTANVMDGEWRRYYESGQLMEIVNFQENAENGPFQEFYENGKPKAEGFYKDGDNEHGLLKLYDESGELIRTMNCINGVCRTVWKKS